MTTTNTFLPRSEFVGNFSSATSLWRAAWRSLIVMAIMLAALGSTRVGAQAPLITQTITFGANPGPITYTPFGFFGVSASGGSSGNPVIFTSLTPTICAPSPATGFFIVQSTGICTVAANQAGNATYALAQQVTQNITINPAPQTITFDPTPATVNPVRCCALPDFTVSATGGSSGNPIVFTSLTPDVCSSFGLQQNFIGNAPGTCIIAADQAGNATYAPAPRVTRSVTILKRNQMIVFGTNPGPVNFTPNSTFAVSAKATPANIDHWDTGNPVFFTSLTTSVCSVAGSTVTTIAPGTCTIAANQPGNANDNPAPQATQSIVIMAPALIPQSLVFGTNPSPVTFARSSTNFTVSVTDASYDPARVNASTPITFSSLTPIICAVQSTSLTPGSAVRGAFGSINMLRAGTCTIAANHAGDANFLAAPQVTQDITIKYGQGIGFRTSADPVTFAPGGMFTIGASANMSVGPIGPTQNLVSFTSLTPSVCTVGGGTLVDGLGGTVATVTIVTAGTCTIAAIQAGDALFNPAPQATQSIVINKAAQTITVDPIPNTNYSEFRSVRVRATSPTFSPVAARLVPVSLTPSVCILAGGSVELSTSGSTSSGISILSAGICNLRFTDPGNTNYLPAPDVDVSFTITKGAQTIGFSVSPSRTILGNAPAIFSARVFSNNFVISNVVTVTSDTPQICTISRNNPVTICEPSTPGNPESCAVFSDTITFNGSGTCTLTATQPGNANYLAAAPVTRTIQVAARAAVQSSSVVARFGDMQTLTANIAGTIPTGTTRFSLSTGEVIPGCAAVPVVNASASCLIPPRYQSLDPLIFSVDYSGDARNPAGTSRFQQTIFYDNAALSTSIEPANPVPAGGRATVTALVRMRSPVGTVSFVTDEYAPVTSALVRTPLAGCDAKPLTMLPNAIDSAVATCTLTAPISGSAKVTAIYRYPADHVSRRSVEEESHVVNVITSPPVNYTDMWWGGARENGWGVSITQHGATQFNVIFAYDSTGKPTWYVMPGCTWSAANTVCTGSLYQPTGAPYSAYDVTRFAANAPVGTGTFTYKSASTATLSYTILGVAGSKEIERQLFGTATTGPNLGVNDLWWNGVAENGWGINIAQQGRQLFPVWYTYGADGKPTFFTVPGGTWNGLVFTGDIYTTTSSPWLGVPYDASRFAASKVGTMVIDYRDANTATISYTIGAVTQTKVIMRQGF